MNININDLLVDFKENEPGISILAANKEKVLYSDNIGIANLEHSIPIMENSVFNLASISKPITAIGVMQLVEQGLINLDDDFVKYIPGFRSKFSKIKVRQLLDHTSGIKNYYEILRELNQTTRDFSNKDFYALMQEHNTLDFPVGERFEYSNSNYVFLALIIEAVCGCSFYEYMKNSLFVPLEMYDTYVYTESKPIIPNLAYGYDNKGDTYYCDYTSTLTQGDGCIFSTPKDLYKLLRGVISYEVLRKDTWNMMISPSRTEKGDMIPYGLGFELSNDNNHRVAYHSGLDAGYRNLLTFYPDKELIIILLSNNSKFSYAARKKITNNLFELVIKFTSL